MIESNAPGNVYHEGEQPMLTFQVENLMDRPIKIRGAVETIRYSQSGVPGDQWNPELNQVADRHGGGTEIWRLWVPGMVYKHFYPRQPKHLFEDAAEGHLEIAHREGTRIVECALPWSEIPHVKKLRDAGRPVKFSFRVNHNARGPDMELARGRSAAEGVSVSFHPNWSPHWPNELEFGFQR